MIDSHLHSKYSHDGQAEIDDIVETALSLGLKYIAITDHIDRDYLFVGYDFFAQIDLSAYIEAVLTAKKKYKNKITIALGAELGYLPEANNSYLSELKGIPFDVILNSTHTVLGHDMYFPPFFEVAGSQENGYREYLKAVRSSLDVPYPYDIIAHLGYVQKNSPFPNNDLRYADYN
ncbi:MAG: histidinol-phosphatase HisJ family protein, partial [Clostridia bacterium]